MPSVSLNQRNGCLGSIPKSYLPPESPTENAACGWRYPLATSMDFWSFPLCHQDSDRRRWRRLGAAAGNVLPGSVVTAMGVAIYAMFMAIVIPPAKKDKAVALCCVAAIALSCLFRYVGVLSKIPEGFTIIICAVAAALAAAVLFPVKEQGGVKNG